VRVILDEVVPENENENAKAWRKFLQGLESCDENESIVEFERVNFGREVMI
jgi:hypothetical protein